MISKITNYQINLLEKKIKHKADEDPLTFEIIKKLTDNFLLTRFLLFPYHLKKIKKITKKEKKKFIAIHFERAKEEMIRFDAENNIKQTNIKKNNNY